MHYNKSWLIEQQTLGARVKFLFFWGHHPQKDGNIGASCLSQWFIAPFEVDGILYPTTEHYMMSEKARLFGDVENLENILQCKSPAEAKKFGRMVRNFDQGIWDAHKYEIVKTGNGHKFNSHPDLKAFLIQSGDRIIVEASPEDPVWGIGIANDHPDVENPERWPGENLLGFVLMEVRDLIHQDR